MAETGMKGITPPDASEDKESRENEYIPETLPTPLGSLSGRPEALPTPLGSLSGHPETLPTPPGSLSGRSEALPAPLSEDFSGLGGRLLRRRARVFMVQCSVLIHCF